MSDSKGLFLPSLRVEGVRAIRFLEIESLARVNLFVGANNAGKTSLLEALRLYAGRAIPQVFRDILQVRGNVFSQTPDVSLEEWSILIDAVQALFHGGLSGAENLNLLIGSVAGDQPRLVVRLGWRPVNEPPLPGGASADVPALAISYGGEDQYVLVSTLAQRPRPYIENQVPFAVYVGPSGVGEERLGALWDRITLTEWEPAVLDALK